MFNIRFSTTAAIALVAAFIGWSGRGHIISHFYLLMMFLFHIKNWPFNNTYVMCLTQSIIYLWTWYVRTNTTFNIRPYLNYWCIFHCTCSTSASIFGFQLLKKMILSVYCHLMARWLLTLYCLCTLCVHSPSTSTFLKIRLTV